MVVTKLALVLVFCNFLCGQTLDLEMVAAAEKIILSDHIHDSKGIHFFNGTRLGDSHKTNDFINELLKRVGSKIAIKSFSSLNYTAPNKTRSFFRVFLLDSIESFNLSLKSISRNFLTPSGCYLVVLGNATDFELKLIFKSFWDLYVSDVNVLATNLDESISVWTFIPFTSAGCNKTDPFLLTTFLNGSFHPEPELFFPDKFQNFHKCPIKVATFESLAPSVLREDYADGTYRLHGSDVDVYTTLSKELNFTLDVFYVTPYGGWGMIFPNGSATGSQGRAIRREADFVLGNLYLKLDRSQHMAYSYTYILDQIVLMIPPGRPLTSFEKLVRPFEIFIWVLLAGTILVGFFVITLLECQSEHIRYFFFGEGVQNPFLNVFIAIFGGSQSKLPQKNFPRYLLMTFLIFCLIIRSLYTGSLFKFLQADDHEKEPQTIEEMAQRDYMFYLITSYDDMTKDSVPMRGRRVIITPSDLKIMMNMTLDLNFKGGLMIALSQVLYKNKVHFKSFLYKVCKEFYSMVPVAIYFPKNSYLVESFNRKLMLFDNAGLILHWASANIDKKYLNFKAVATGPKRITLQHFSGTFQTLFGGLVLSILVFVLECFWTTVKKIKTPRIQIFQNQFGESN